MCLPVYRQSRGKKNVCFEQYADSAEGYDLECELWQQFTFLREGEQWQVFSCLTSFAVFSTDDNNMTNNMSTK